ncbi:hypothetical protein [Vibrio campbellii]|uniref:hypothetical protein n=1 Tax=Vibrio campbellii TaxID=680 RepID=UPI000CD33771|nr:hypothetical protein [Vibrio campbellii]AUW07405.1 hypothetical protein C1N51_27505 [Vibrio campbellii]
MVNKLLLIVILVIPSYSYAYISSAPSMGSIGNDEIRTSDGASCRSERGGNLLVYAQGYDTNEEGYYDGANRGVSVGIAYRFGGAKPVDCTKLYDRELKVKDLEIQKMQAEIEQLRKLNSISDGIASGVIPPLPKQVK